MLHTPEGSRWNFQARALFAVSPTGGLATASSNAYSINLPAAEGWPARIERPAPAVRLGLEEREEWTAWARYLTEQVSGAVFEIPTRKPVIRDIQVDMFDRLWVHLYVDGVRRVVTPRPKGDKRPLLAVREPNTYDVIARGSAYLGRVVLPFHSVLLNVQRQHVWVRQEDEDGRQTLVRYRLLGLGGK